MRFTIDKLPHTSLAVGPLGHGRQRVGSRGREGPWNLKVMTSLFPLKTTLIFAEASALALIAPKFSLKRRKTRNLSFFALAQETDDFLSRLILKALKFEKELKIRKKCRFLLFV